ncbi:MAG: sn-glycerol-3-phosphate ABC transporter ATP-binding protein UgpC [Paraburkholderia sp.]|uniref:ABC transporter ATP-binding protein n=1 Tax=Paraburkholderia sp. TaxID=1926495 RepID=UPI00120E850D|nr:sn-glycerol-3-phosphate ABC transporter ATP-binding protein UgpC [Paraburkholderia sp.]TAL95363.1 MAG: sn-glycerol-3-phosphate ABC transporter ATP-binding protein UgpC [Paraburkholderia sp.]
MSSISIRKLHKRYDNTEVIRGVDVDIAEGEFVALVGSSGCGKSTLLRMVAGLESVTDGDILLGDESINDLAPKDRNIAMVFQNYALYPHMTVARNLGFSLQLNGVFKAEIATRVNDVAQSLGLTALLERLPRQLSGGQRQRVAMGRAIVRQPQAFLFDEPLSNLDASLRVRMRTEIKALHQRLRTTTIYVTHDQVEAMTMADRIVVLKDGLIEQVGTPLELYDAPRNAFVAGFIGSPSMNFIPGRLDLNNAPHVVTDDGLQFPLAAKPNAIHGSRVIYGARPEHFVLDATGRGLSAEVVVVEPTGSETQIAVRLAGQDVITAFRERIDAGPGDQIHLLPHGDRAHLFDADSGIRLN